MKKKIWLFIIPIFFIFFFIFKKWKNEKKEKEIYKDFGLEDENQKKSMKDIFSSFIKKIKEKEKECEKFLMGC